MKLIPQETDLHSFQDLDIHYRFEPPPLRFRPRTGAAETGRECGFKASPEGIAGSRLASNGNYPPSPQPISTILLSLPAAP
jgi:hypothetical protein